jgi:hypothetical protein
MGDCVSKDQKIQTFYTYWCDLLQKHFTEYYK